MTRISLFAGALLLCSCTRTGGPPYSPAEEQKRIRLQPGFRIELVAAEPDVVDPVAITFDESGRIYAVEMRDYPMGDSPSGRVRLLDDKDGDGRFESSTVFADDLKLPNGVMRWRKGILVTSTPDILYLEDSDGDGKADIRRKMLTGFASQNPQLRLNGPQYGIDNWIYVAYPRRSASRRYAREFGDRGSKIRFADGPETRGLDIHSRDVRFRPDDRRIEALAGFSQFGWGFNEDGDRFVVWNSDHIRHVPIDGATLDRNPNLAIANPWESVSDHKPQSTVFPVTENPNWIHDSQVGQFTSACGFSIYTGANLSPDFQNNSLTCEPVHNLIHRDVLKPRGGTYVASRAYEKSEFVAATDSWFRPVFTMTGPDGALYIVDYYRPSVEHPEFVPPELLKDLDFTTKHQKGRIWRVWHELSKKRPRPALDKAGNEQLAALLSDANSWWRLQAQRLLVDRKAVDVVPLLEEAARSSSNPYGRIHALWTLDGLGALKDGLVAGAMKDTHAVVRRHGIRLAALRPSLQGTLVAMAGDADSKVRYEAALALAALPEEKAFGPLLAIAKQDPADPWLQTVVLSNARSNPLRWFSAITAWETTHTTFVRRVASLIGSRGADSEIAVLLGAVPAPQSRAWSAALIEGLAEGVRASSAMAGAHPRAQAAVIRLLEGAEGSAGDAVLGIASALKAGPRIPAAMLAAAAKTAESESAPLDRRAHAVGIAGLGPATEGNLPVAKFLAPQYPAEVRAAAARAMSRLPPEISSKEFVANWRSLTGPMRETAMSSLMASPASIARLFDAIEDNRIQPWAVGQARMRNLQAHPDPMIRERARKLFSQVGADRMKVLERYMPAAHKTGDPRRGKAVFERVCAECHRLDGVGEEVGPDLRGVTKRYKETLLAGIIMPSEAIEPGYEEYVVETKDGRMFTGVLAKDTPASITLRRAKGAEDVIPRSEIRELRTGGTSPMPDELEKDITVDEMADLIAYLKVPK